MYTQEEIEQIGKDMFHNHFTLIETLDLADTLETQYDADTTRYLLTTGWKAAQSEEHATL